LANLVQKNLLTEWKPHLLLFKFTLATSW